MNVNRKNKEVKKIQEIQKNIKINNQKYI